jgi:hypothetical protein
MSILGNISSLMYMLINGGRAILVIKKPPSTSYSSLPQEVN